MGTADPNVLRAAAEKRFKEDESRRLKDAKMQKQPPSEIPLRDGPSLKWTIWRKPRTYI